jgi:hypothetical protein
MRKFLLVALAVLGMAACSDSTGLGGGSTSGTYTLRTVNGANLPAIIFQVGAERLEIMSASASLNADMTYTMMLSLRETVGTASQTTSDTDNGTYTEINGALRMTSFDTSVVTGSVGSGTLTLVGENGIVLVFRK